MHASGFKIGAGVAVGAEDFFGGFEVELAGLGQDAGAFGGDEFGGDLFDFGGASFWDGFDAVGFFHAAQSVKEGGAREDGGGGDGGVGLGFGALIHFDFFAVFHQRAFDAMGGAEFIGEGARAVGHFFEEIFDGARVAPGEDAVDVFHAGVHAVVGFGAEGDDGEFSVELFADGGGELQGDAVAGNLFAVFGADFLKDCDGFGVGVDGGDDERAKEVAFAAFVDSHMGLDTLGVVDGFVAEAGFARDVGFENKGDPLFCTFPLNETFAGVVEVDAAVVGGDGNLGVGDFDRGVFWVF